MKLRYLVVLTMAAYVMAVAFRSALRQPAAPNMKQWVAEKKKFSIRCSPAYSPAAGDDIPLLTGWGNYNWPITSTVDSARIYFNQGINMYYAFHIIESRASFEKAITFDPNCAMAWWGKALAYGPNINDFGYQRPSQAYPSASKANALKANASPVERALIEAITLRYAADSATDQAILNARYRDAMKAIYKAYPSDENVCTLYADALMLMHPWNLYDHDFKALPWTAEIVQVLKQALTLNPGQPGANHYYIHAVEASAKPGDALASATFLASAMPDVSHLTHMPSHIYIRTGFYDKGITVNDRGLEGYNKYLSYFPPTEENTSLYNLHNIHMKINCAQMAGNYDIAAKASAELKQQIPSFYLQIPGALGNYVQYLHRTDIFTWVRFGKWTEIISDPVADTLSFTAALQHFARGMAFANTNKIPEAEKELEIMENKMTDPSLKEPLVPFNAVYDAAMIGKHLLAGTLAENKQNLPKAIDFFSMAVQEEDKLIYNEPRDWLLPARQYLGAALVKAGRFKEAIAVFKKDLQINPNNGWALTGLQACYRQQKNTAALSAVQKQLKTAWSIKDTPVEAAVF
ncbi:MAG: tetratricopeptide repeat protein [Ferruginibacter sp.]